MLSQRGCFFFAVLLLQLSVVAGLFGFSTASFALVVMSVMALVVAPFSEV